MDRCQSVLQYFSEFSHSMMDRIRNLRYDTTQRLSHITRSDTENQRYWTCQPASFFTWFANGTIESRWLHMHDSLTSVSPTDAVLICSEMRTNPLKMMDYLPKKVHGSTPVLIQGFQTRLIPLRVDVLRSVISAIEYPRSRSNGSNRRNCFYKKLIITCACPPLFLFLFSV